MLAARGWQGNGSIGRPSRPAPARRRISLPHIRSNASVTGSRRPPPAQDRVHRRNRHSPPCCPHCAAKMRGFRGNRETPASIRRCAPDWSTCAPATRFGFLRDHAFGEEAPPTIHRPYERLFRYLARLRPSGAEPARPEEIHAGLLERRPEFAGLLNLLRHCVALYGDLFSGATAGTEVLYPGGSGELLREALSGAFGRSSTSAMHVRLAKELAPLAGPPPAAFIARPRSGRRRRRPHLGDCAGPGKPRGVL